MSSKEPLTSSLATTSPHPLEQSVGRLRHSPACIYQKHEPYICLVIIIIIFKASMTTLMFYGYWKTVSHLFIVFSVFFIAVFTLHRSPMTRVGHVVIHKSPLHGDVTVRIRTGSHLATAGLQMSLQKEINQ